MDSKIKQALFAMGYGALGAVLIQGIVWAAIPQPVRFAQVDLVAIMGDEIQSLAKSKMDGKTVSPEQRAKEIQAAVAGLAADSRRVIIARQALVAGPTADIPDYTDDLRARLR